MQLPPSSAPGQGVGAPLSLYPGRPNQRRRHWLELVGEWVLRALQALGALCLTLVRVVASLAEPSASAVTVSRRLTVRQIFFTGSHALPLVSIVAALVGMTIILQTKVVAAEVSAQFSGRLLVALVLRESAPLVTAILVAARSGTAIATELGNMRASYEVLALASLGINPSRFLVMPRLVACTVSVLVLTVYFGAVALGAGFAVSRVMDGVSFAALLGGLEDTVVAADLPLFLIKGLGLGVIVGWLSCHFGLQVQASPTEVPRKASQAVVLTVLGCVAYNTLCTAGFYLLTRAA